MSTYFFLLLDFFSLDSSLGFISILNLGINLSFKTQISLALAGKAKHQKARVTLLSF